MNAHRISPTSMRRVVGAVEHAARLLKLTGDAVKRCIDRALRWLREGVGADAAINIGKHLARRIAEGKA